MRNISRKELKSIRSLTRWFRRISKWWSSTKWSRNNLNKTWSYRLMRKELFLRDKESWKSTKRKWSEDTLISNSREPMISRLWKMQLRLKERLFLRNWSRRRKWGELSQSILKIWEMSCKCRRWRKELELRREKMLKDDNSRRKSW
jgi:hypothetical protein